MKPRIIHNRPGYLECEIPASTRGAHVVTVALGQVSCTCDDWGDHESCAHAVLAEALTHVPAPLPPARIAVLP